MAPRKNYGRTRDGELITEEFVEEAAREAEVGFDLEGSTTWRQVHPRTYVHLYAVVRIDDGPGTDGDRFTVKEVLPSRDEAVAEVARLNGLNADQGATYSWQSVQYYPNGRGSQAD